MLPVPVTNIVEDAGLTTLATARSVCEADVKE